MLVRESVRLFPLQADESSAAHVLTLAAVEGLHGSIPARDLSVETENDDPRVEALQDILVVVLQLAQLLGLRAQTPVEPAVHDCRGGLRGQSAARLILLAYLLLTLAYLGVKFVTDVLIG